jgi:hypothetical protein
MAFFVGVVRKMRTGWQRGKKRPGNELLTGATTVLAPAAAAKALVTANLSHDVT